LDHAIVRQELSKDVLLMLIRINAQKDIIEDAQEDANKSENNYLHVIVPLKLSKNVEQVDLPRQEIAEIIPFIAASESLRRK